MVRYESGNLKRDMSMLEALDVLNEELIQKGEEPVTFEHDCREGICGSCGFMINGVAHGPLAKTTVCQLTLRHFKDGEQLYLEPWRARAFPVLRDLMVDRAAFDRIIAAGGYISIRAGSAPDGNTIPVPKEKPTWRWTRRRASAAEPAWPRVRMRRRRCSRARKSAISDCCRKGSRSGNRGP